MKEKLDQIINNIENQNYTYNFDGFGYSYSKEITDIFEILQSDEYKKICDENIEDYSFDKKKELDQKTNPDNYTLVDCIIVLNWIWHLEAGLAVGTIIKKLKDGSYLKILKKFRSFMD